MKIIDYSFGLTGFWNKEKRKQIIKLIEIGLPKDYIIEKISFLTAERIHPNREIYRIYVQYAHKTKGYSIKYNYWQYRNNSFALFDLKNNTTNF